MSQITTKEIANLAEYLLVQSIELFIIGDRYQIRQEKNSGDY